MRGGRILASPEEIMQLEKMSWWMEFKEWWMDEWRLYRDKDDTQKLMLSEIDKCLEGTVNSWLPENREYQNRNTHIADWLDSRHFLTG